MLDFRAVTVEDSDRYNKYRAVDMTNASEGVFTTMFIWDEYYNLEFAENGEFLFIRFNIKGKSPSYFFPIGNGDLKKAITELSEYCRRREEKLIFRLVSKENAEKLKALEAGMNFVYSESTDSYDYVYLTERMISLSGKKLHSKRNHLNFFLENYKYEYISVDNENLLEECAAKALSWVRAKEKNRNPYEAGAMERYFENFFKLKQKGAVIKVDCEIAAMSFGERLNSDMALIQIELADENYRGAYQAINKLFCENEWKSCKYVNREEDMGIEGLRKAKRGYQPEFMVEKYYVEEEM